MSDGDTEPVYEWDEVKRRSNIAKHGVDFTEMASFAWDTAAGILDDRYEEPRWIAIGFIGTRLHVAVYTVRSGIIRIISLRKANGREERGYAKSRQGS